MVDCKIVECAEGVSEEELRNATTSDCLTASLAGLVDLHQIARTVWPAFDPQSASCSTGIRTD